MKQPNVLLCTVDSLRADSVYSDETKTPTFDKLASDSVTYDAAFAQGPFTTFSMPSLFTSRYPSGLNYMEFSDSTVGVYINNEPTLPEALRRNGYQTAGFHSNPLLSNLFGFDRRFDTFDARLPFSNTDFLPGRTKILTDKLLRICRKHAYLPAERLNERVIDWLNTRDTADPFFLWVHYMDVHGPYIAKEGFHYLNKYRGERLWRKAVTKPDEITEREHERLQKLYQEEVEYTDTQLGNLFDNLRDQGLWDETVVAVTSDHGEGFGEHGTYSHPHHLYDELTHVPLILRDPDNTPGTVDVPVELIDLAPTLVERVDISPPDTFAGTSLKKIKDASNSSTIAISEADIVPDYNASIRTERYRYIQNEVAEEEELYDIQNDPGENHNLVDEQPDIREKLASKLEDHLSSPQREIGPDRDVTKTNIEEESVQDRLQDLGYLE